MAYIVKPFTADDLRPAIDIAHSRWLELIALEAEVADLGERLETRKLVDRAKGVLMTQLKLSEADAFRWIQKTAMDRRLGMKRSRRPSSTGSRRTEAKASDERTRHPGCGPQVTTRSPIRPRGVTWRRDGSNAPQPLDRG